MKKGYIHVYTGDGKGKTTAAIGLITRALGAGMRVLLVQFLKKGEYSEIRHLRNSGNIEIRQYGTGRFVKGRPTTEDIENAKRGLEEAKKAIKSGDYDLVVLDEINVVVALGLIPLKDVLDLLNTRPDSVEIVLTGRGAHPKLLDVADLVTEMQEIKHYYKKGVLARHGIEK